LRAIECFGKERNRLLEEEQKEEKAGIVVDEKRRLSIYELTLQQEMKQGADPVTTEVIDDEKHSLVYMISIDRNRKEIKLIFRGSVTIDDWLKDLNIMGMKQLPNPLYDDNKKNETTFPQREMVGIHKGFFDYLLHHKGKDGKSKFEVIHEHLDRFHEEYPDFTLSVTGHSLGAALATLFSYLTVCEYEGKTTVKTPIKCYVFASPRVGNDSFVQSFQELEIQGKIQFLRVANKRDFITKMPERSLFPNADINMFKHAGIELKLYPKKDCKINYPAVYGKSNFSRFWRGSMQTVRYYIPYPTAIIRLMQGDIIKFHFCDSYTESMDRQREKLQTITVEQIPYLKKN